MFNIFRSSSRTSEKAPYNSNMSNNSDGMKKMTMVFEDTPALVARPYSFQEALVLAHETFSIPAHQPLEMTYQYLTLGFVSVSEHNWDTVSPTLHTLFISAKPTPLTPRSTLVGNDSPVVSSVEEIHAEEGTGDTPPPEDILISHSPKNSSTPPPIDSSLWSHHSSDQSHSSERSESSQFSPSSVTPVVPPPIIVPQPIPSPVPTSIPSLPPPRPTLPPVPPGMRPGSLPAPVPGPLPIRPGTRPRPIPGRPGPNLISVPGPTPGSNVFVPNSLPRLHHIEQEPTMPPPPSSLPPPPSSLTSFQTKPGHLSFFVCNVGYGQPHEQKEYRRFEFREGTTIGELKAKIVEEFNMSSYLQNLWLPQWEGGSFRWREVDTSDEERLESASVTEGCSIILTRTMVMRKPVIYLFPPQTGSIEEHGINIEVDVRLREGWRFDCTYPPPSFSSRTTAGDDEDKDEDVVVWRVRAYPSGELEAEQDEITASFLFWEAKHSAIATLPTPSSSGRTSPYMQSSHECASTMEMKMHAPSLGVNPKNSILLQTSDASRYLHHILKYLGLHVEARTSFITYWLPSIQKHDRIALRFLAQQDYEYYAPMKITPTVDIVRRIFMVFRGVPVGMYLNYGTETSSESGPTAPRGYTRIGDATQDGKLWWDVIGLGDETESAKWMDKTQFRVLEWGGLELD